MTEFIMVIGWVTIFLFSLFMGASNLVLLRLVLSHRIFVRGVQAELYDRLDRIEALLRSQSELGGPRP